MQLNFGILKTQSKIVKERPWKPTLINISAYQSAKSLQLPGEKVSQVQSSNYLLTVRYWGYRMWLHDFENFRCEVEVTAESHRRLPKNPITAHMIAEERFWRKERDVDLSGYNSLARAKFWLTRKFNHVIWFFALDCHNSASLLDLMWQLAERMHIPRNILPEERG